MITTTPAKIGLAMGAVNSLLSAKLPVKAAYSLGKLARACQVEMECFTKARNKIFTDAGCKIEGKNFVHEDPAKLAEAVKTADELGEVEVQINALPLDLEQFKDCEVPGNGFYALDWAMKPETATAE